MSSNSSLKNPFGTIIQIGNCLVSEDVVSEYFACDYEKCRGVCCVIGDGGAPLREDEIECLEQDYENYSSFMTPLGKEVAESEGFFEIDNDGDIVTPTIKEAHKVAGLDCITGAMDGVVGTQGLEDCAYIHYERLTGASSVSCMCSIEKCFLKGGCKFRKPISCSLYPIRVTKFSNGTDALNLHRWNICKDAFIKGKNEGIRVYEFLKNPLERLYGKEFYLQLEAAAEYINGDAT
jgi:hypothetical protein